MKAKQKGYRFEIAVRDMLREKGIPAERVPLSGSMGGAFADDIVIGTLQNPIMRGEAKHRENINKQLWEWLNGVDFTILKRNHKEPIVLITFEEFVEYIKWKTTAI